jgi:hypothetical protein
MSQDQWKDVRSKVEGLGLKLKLHLEQEDDDANERQPGSTRKAFEDLGDRLEDAFEAFGNAAKDPAVRADVKELGVLLKDAIQESLSGVGAEVRQAGERMKEGRSRGGDTATGGEGGADSPIKDSPDDTVQDTVEGGEKDG